MIISNLYKQKYPNTIIGFWLISDCRAAYGVENIKESMICAGEEGKDSCQGDSGGPLTCDGMHCGIASWGYGCGTAGYPGVYTETSYFVEWIMTHTI